MADGLRIDRVRLREELERKEVVIEVDLVNELERTVHVHATPRIVNYDPATHHLAVEMSDEHLNREIPSKALRRPKFKAVDPQRKSTMRIRLPRIIHRLGPGPDERVPGIESLPIHEATDIDVAVAWSDTPFYPDPRDGGETKLGDVVKWQQGTVRGSGRHRRAASDEGDSAPA